MIYISVNDLANEVIIRAIFSIIIVVISLLTGIKLMFKYKKYKDSLLITAGLTWIFIGSTYWALSIGFLSILIFNYELDHSIILMLQFGFIPLAIIFWVYTFGKVYNKEKFKLMFFPVLIYFMLIFIIQMVLVFLNYENIAVYSNIPSDPFQYRITLIPFLTSIPGLIFVLISGTLFCIKSFKSKDSQIVWKGRFIFIGVYAYVFGTMLELALQIVARTILIFSSVFYYLGWHLPKGLEKRLIKE